MSIEILAGRRATARLGAPGTGDGAIAGGERGRVVRGLAVCVVALGVTISGCTTLITAPTAYHVFDLGSTARDASSASVAPASVEVRAPSWLASAAMQYRLDHVEPSSREIFAESRWAAPPGDLLQHWLNASFASRDGVRPGLCRLRLDLDEFVLAFDSATSSHAVLGVRAALFSPREDAAIARQSFDIRVPAATADARGGVLAHREAVRRLAHGLAAWLASLDAADGQGLNVLQRCRG